jgi:ABC-type phosphate transport system substrate-binding protein
MGRRAHVVPAVLTMCLTGCAISAPPSAKVTLGGAQIPVELVQSWLQDAKPPRFYVEQVAPVYMSQHGFENLARGECDLACTDRPITIRELPQFNGKPVRGQRVAFYGYALYVNRENPLDAIFSRHVRLVFQKRIKDWQELAGPQVPQWEGPIKLYGPVKSTRAGMILSPLANIWFAEPTWEVLDSDTEIIAKVAADPLALGFASIGHDGEGVRYLGLRLERRADPSFPSLEEIESERYGLAKLIYIYYTEPPNPTVQAVLDYLLSDEGRTAIEGTDLWAVQPERSPVPPPQ